MKGWYTGVLIVSVLVTYWLRPKELGSERAIWRRRGEDWLPPCAKNIIDLHLECNEGESLDTAYGPTGFSAFTRPPG